MKIRRIGDEHSPSGQRLQIIEGPLGATVPGWLSELGEVRGAGDAWLPFQPRSFRDCMLFEQHWIQASRGFAKRFMPSAYRVTRFYEWLLRRPFPAFQPPALSKRQPIYYLSNHLTIIPAPHQPPQDAHPASVQAVVGRWRSRDRQLGRPSHRPRCKALHQQLCVDHAHGERARGRGDGVPGHDGL